jgi:hypothetical protein
MKGILHKNMQGSLKQFINTRKNQKLTKISNTLTQFGRNKRYVSF